MGSNFVWVLRVFYRKVVRAICASDFLWKILAHKNGANFHFIQVVFLFLIGFVNSIALHVQ